MKYKLKIVRGAKNTEGGLLKKSEIYADLLEAITYLRPDIDEQDIFMLAHLQLLAIADIKQLKDITNKATAQAIEKAKEVSVLNSKFYSDNN